MNQKTKKTSQRQLNMKQAQRGRPKLLKYGHYILYLRKFRHASSLLWKFHFTFSKLYNVKIILTFENIFNFEVVRSESYSDCATLKKLKKNFR